MLGSKRLVLGEASRPLGYLGVFRCEKEVFSGVGESLSMNQRPEKWSGVQWVAAGVAVVGGCVAR